jgi:hypothetical protein
VDESPARRAEVVRNHPVIVQMLIQRFNCNRQALDLNDAANGSAAITAISSNGTGIKAQGGQRAGDFTGRVNLSADVFVGGTLHAGNVRCEGNLSTETMDIEGVLNVTSKRGHLCLAIAPNNS